MVDRGKYLASREWMLLKKQVKERSGGKCERCGYPANQVHHLTYERFGGERVEDLQHVCRLCHEYLSAASNFDPALISPLMANGEPWSDEDREYMQQACDEAWRFFREKDAKAMKQTKCA